MKSYLFALLFLFIAISAYSQKVVIPKGANRIEVTATLSDSALLDMIAFRLESASFFIDHLDKSKGYLMTEYKNMGGEISIKVIVNIKDNTAVFSGHGDGVILNYKYTNTPLLYKGSAGGIEKGGFILLDETVRKLAKTIGASRLIYLTPQSPAQDSQ